MVFDLANLYEQENLLTMNWNLFGRSPGREKEMPRLSFGSECWFSSKLIVYLENGTTVQIIWSMQPWNQVWHYMICILVDFNVS